ncbi:MAG: YraN family protein [Bacteroidales bacterium]|nr:YraN family protein [Bacteroidales bacterium]
MSEHNYLGNKGEQIAKSYLENNSFNILEQNWRFRHKEIDIIAIKNSIIRIVEVKSRSGNYLELPRWSVTKKKQADLIIAANAYIEQNQFENEVYFDIIEVILSRGKFYVRYIPEAFYPIV